MRCILFLYIACLIPLFSISQEKIPYIDIEDIFTQMGNIPKESEGYFQKNLDLLNKVNKSDSTYCDVLVSKSYYLLNMGKYEEAIQLTNEGISLECPDSNLSFYINKGLSYVYLGKYEDGLEVYNEGLKLYSKNSQLWYLKGNALEKLDRINEAVLAYQNSITLNPTYAKPHLQLGNLCYKQGLISQALMCYNIYLILSIEEEDVFNTLKSLNNLVEVKNNNIPNPDLKISNDDEFFKTIDLVLTNKIALNKNYETGNKINISLTRQNHALIEQLKDFEGQGGFWDTNYVQLFKWISEKNLFNNFIYTLCYSIQNED